MNEVRNGGGDGRERARAPVAVYGAAGYTGRRVAAELVRRGRAVVLSGRDERALRDVAATLEGRVEVRPARVDEPDELRRAFAGCAAVVHCAGPFSATGEQVVRAALAAGCHYLDTTAEQAYMRVLFERHEGAARDAGLCLVPAVGFYYLLGDLLAHLVGADMDAIDEVTVAYGVRGWRLTRGSRLTALGVTRSRSVFRGGRLEPAPRRVGASRFAFPSPLGSQPVIEYPTGEVLTVPRHLRTAQMTTLLSTGAFPSGFARVLPALATSALAPLLVGLAPLVGLLLRVIPDRVQPAERADSTFTVAVRATGGGSVRTGSISGTDIYGLSAITAAESVVRLTEPSFVGRGVLAPAEAFDARSFLDSLAPWGVRWEMHDGRPQGSPRLGPTARGCEE